MNCDTIIQTPAQPSSRAGTMRKAGTGLTGLMVLFLAFDGITKVIRVAPVMDACQKMGIGPDMAAAIGLLLLACTVIYVVPRTALFGAVLLTGFLGGAAATHIVHGSGAFPAGFAVGCGVLVWTGLVLREPCLLRWMFRRGNTH